MFVAMEPIPVVFGPHEGDVWMIVATLLSFSTSFVVAVVAAKNGARATKIAKEASDRDQAYRDAEVKRRRNSERFSAAAAMIRAFWALDAAIEHANAVPGTPEAGQAARRANTLMADALVEVELLHPDEQPRDIADWFNRTIARTQSLRANDAIRHPYRGEAVGTVRRWNSRIVTVDEFLDPDRRL